MNKIPFYYILYNFIHFILIYLSFILKLLLTLSLFMCLNILRATCSYTGKHIKNKRDYHIDDQGYSQTAREALSSVEI